MDAARLLLISTLAALLGAIGGEVAVGGDVRSFGPVIFVSCFTLLGSLGLLAPAYAIMKFSRVSLLRRYVGVLTFGAVAGSMILLPLDLAMRHLDAAPLGGLYGAITAASWVTLHAISKALMRSDEAVS